ncbi:MAG: SdpI family protein [Patescibacteria group bacterium]|nr:SdpI family protein [Patescibacteria group bacterium]
MPNNNLKKEFIPIIFIIATIIISVVTYNHLPKRVITHWNFQGVADGWSSKNFHTIFFPCLIVFMYIMFYFLPKIDPKKERYKEFETTYLILKTTTIGVLFLIFLIATLVNLGYKIPVSKSVSLIIGLMIILMGKYMSKIKNNYFVGIKTPWTLSSEYVWNKTHKFGAWTFVIFGLIIIISPYLNVKYSTILFLLGILLTVFGTMIYSYILYAKEQKNTKK